MGGAALGRALEYQPHVSVISADADVDVTAVLEYPSVEVVQAEDDTLPSRTNAARSASGDVLAFLARVTVLPELGGGDGSVLRRQPVVAAVTMAAMAPSEEAARARAAAAIWESRLGGGALHYRFMPGNIRVVRDFPASNMLIRREDFRDRGSGRSGSGRADFRASRRLGRITLYTPDTFVLRSVPPLFGAHLRQVADYGRTRGRTVKARGRDALRVSTLLPLAILGGVAAALPALLVGGLWTVAWLLTLLAYVSVVAAAATLAALRLHLCG